MTDNAPNDMPDEVCQLIHEAYEIYAGMEGGKAETCYEGYLLQEMKKMATLIGKAKKQADLRAPVSAGEKDKLKYSEDYLITEIEKIVAEFGDAPKTCLEIIGEFIVRYQHHRALQQPPAPAVDLKSLKKVVPTGFDTCQKTCHQAIGWNDCLDHLAASGYIVTKKEGK